MAKRSGQPEHLNICMKCKAATKWEDKVRISVFMAERDKRFPNISSNHVERVKGFTNLCKSCYEEYQKVLNEFLEV